MRATALRYVGADIRTRHAMPIFLKATVLFLMVTAWAAPGAAEADDPWPSISKDVFAGRPIVSAGDAMTLYAPESVADAALVPVTIRLSQQAALRAKHLHLIVDRNPAPIAAVFTFGAAYTAASSIGERRLETRLRVDSFSQVRAILEMTDGRLLMAATFVAGAGGCTSPSSKDADQALAELGRVRVMTVADKNRGEHCREGRVMIRHPNFTGMQMDVKSGNYTPARFVRAIHVTQAGAPVLRIESGISLSEDPNLRFTFDAANGEDLTLTAEDSDGAKFSGQSGPGG